MLAGKQKPIGREHEQISYLPLLADASVGCIDGQRTSLQQELQLERYGRGLLTISGGVMSSM